MMMMMRSSVTTHCLLVVVVLSTCLSAVLAVDSNHATQQQEQTVEYVTPVLMEDGGFVDSAKKLYRDFVDKKDDVVSQLKEEWNGHLEILQNAAKGISLKVTKKLKDMVDENLGKCKVLREDDDVDEITNKNLCSSLGLQGDHFFSDTLPSVNGLPGGVLTNSQMSKHVSPRMQVRFWTEAARMAMLSEFAYEDFVNVRRKDIQVLRAWDKHVSGADAFMAIRNSDYMPPRSTFDYGQIRFNVEEAVQARKAEWDKYYETMCEVWDSSKGAPAAIEIVVRGTASGTDWLINSQFKQTPFKVADKQGKPVDLGMVHSGFLKQAQAIWEQIDKAMEDMPSLLKSVLLKETKLYFTGHSLGGAVAQLLALRYAARYNRYGVKVYTFGSPRVGNPKFASQMRTYTIHYRYKFMGDVVSEVPLPHMFGDHYEHGDSFAIGLGIRTLSTFYASSHFIGPRANEMDYFAYCVPECSKTTTILKQVLTYHAMDFSYAHAIRMMWLWQRDESDDKRSVFVDKWKNHDIIAIERQIGDEMSGYDGLLALRCMGNRVCQRVLKYPATSPTDEKECEEETKRQGVYFNSAEVLFDGEDYIDRVYAFERVYAKCMIPRSAGLDYYNSLKSEDWLKCLGNVYCINFRRRMRTRCFDSVGCELELIAPGVSIKNRVICVLNHAPDLRKDFYLGNPAIIEEDHRYDLRFPKMHYDDNVRNFERPAELKPLYDCLFKHTPANDRSRYKILDQKDYEECRGDIACLREASDKEMKRLRGQKKSWKRHLQPKK